MAFNFFKKKKQKEMDLTGSMSDGIPLPKHLQKKVVPIKSSDGIINLSDTSSQINSETAKQPANSGGFFNFFGSDSSSYASAPAPSSDSASQDSSQINNKLDEISDRLSKLLDRVELLERKMDRFERKSY